MLCAPPALFPSAGTVILRTARACWSRNYLHKDRRKTFAFKLDCNCPAKSGTFYNHISANSTRHSVTLFPPEHIFSSSNQICLFILTRLKQNVRICTSMLYLHYIYSPKFPTSISPFIHTHVLINLWLFLHKTRYFEKCLAYNSSKWSNVVWLPTYLLFVSPVLCPLFQGVLKQMVQTKSPPLRDGH